jgi:glycosyltransferase involved in cell wall biosynthesis
MKLSIVIPVYNEEQTVLSLLKLVRDAPYPNKEVIVVDDGSTDRTPEVLATADSGLYDALVRHETNFGKGAAIRTGLKLATGEMVIVQDADLEYDPVDWNLLVEPVLADKADVVYGSRFVTAQSRRVLYFWHAFGNQVLTGLSNVFTNLNLTDMETCYKLFRTDVLKSLNLVENRFGFEPEVTAKLSRAGVRIYEVGISYSGRTYADGKKIGWKDGVRAIWAIVKYNTWSRT